LESEGIPLLPNPRIQFAPQYEKPRTYQDKVTSELEALKNKIISKGFIVTDRIKPDFSGKVSHIFACESDLADLENKYPECINTKIYRDVRQLLDCIGDT
jgi:hypothetical protein